VLGPSRLRVDRLVLCLPTLKRDGPNTNNLNPSRFLKEIGVA